jgi:hypothetical protein
VISFKGCAETITHHRRRDGIVQIHALDPRLALGLVLARLDHGREVLGPRVGGRVGLPAGAAEHLLGNARVPDVVEVDVLVAPAHVDAVAAALDVLGVHGLVDVADKVDDKLGGLAAPPRRQVRVQQLVRVVLDGANDAAVGLAVARKVDAAVVRRRVLGVDEVEVLGEAPPPRVPDAVGPRRHARQVVLRVVAQQALEVVGRLRLDKVAGDVGYRDVPQACVQRDASVKQGSLLSVPSPRPRCPSSSSSSFHGMDMAACQLGAGRTRVLLTTPGGHGWEEQPKGGGAAGEPHGYISRLWRG